MKFTANLWNRKYDGIQFFVQRLEEMLFHYSDDIVRSPVHNTQTLIVEYIETEKAVNEGKVKAYMLSPILSELQASLEQDKILRKHFGDEFVDTIAKNIAKEKGPVVRYLHHKMPQKQYHSWCKEYIREHVMQTAMSSNIETVVQTQREYFSTGATLSYEFRMDALCKLEAAMKANEQKIYAALHADLGKSETEAFMCEVGLVQCEITWMKKNLKKLMKRQKVKTPMSQFVADSFRIPSPYGTVLIMSPWNYPVLVALSPLVAALGAGNTAVLKPSSYSPATSELIKTMLEETFPAEYVCVITGGRAENQELLHQHFDKIFFTGSTAVGKEVMRCASEHLTPVTLELGGKSPCLVEKSAKISLTAKRIVFGKFVNCGQTCVAPDYILCDSSIRDQLVEAIKQEICTQFGEHPLENKNYGKIINEKHYNRLLGLINAEKIVHGGDHDEAACRIEPTVMADVSWEDAVMQEEIFGPILPILTYENLEQAIGIIESRPRPLAFYLFTEDKAVIDRILTKCRFGGGCINDCIIHLATSEMPFGGVGESGIGCYHGKFGFEEFSHLRSIVDKKTWLDLPARYQPYTEENYKLMRNAMK